MASSMRTRLKQLAVAASALWVAMTIYQEFFDVDPDQFGFKSPEVEAQMSSCGGTFKQRYDCKEAAILAKGRDSFLIWMWKVTIILGPPIALVVLFQLAERGRRPEDEQEVRRHRPRHPPPRGPIR